MVKNITRGVAKVAPLLAPEGEIDRMDTEVYGIKQALKALNGAVGISHLFKLVSGGHIKGAYKIYNTWAIPVKWCRENAIPEGFVKVKKAARLAGVSKQSVYNEIEIKRFNITIFKSAISNYGVFVNVHDAAWNAFVAYQTERIGKKVNECDTLQSKTQSSRPE